LSSTIINKNKSQYNYRRYKSIAKSWTSKTLFMTVTTNARIIATKKTSRRTIEVFMLILKGSVLDFNLSPFILIKYDE
jgi:hypothetical protein